jgi:hypothetical protein
MKKTLSVLAMALLTVGGVVHAADEAKSNNKMAACNKESAGKTGDDRKAFMSSCLSAKPVAKPESKMSTCNKASAGKTGDDRKAFMSSCLSKQAA